MTDFKLKQLKGIEWAILPGKSNSQGTVIPFSPDHSTVWLMERVHKAWVIKMRIFACILHLHCVSFVKTKTTKT